jgi:hypothetical protein
MKSVIRSDKAVTLLLLFWSHKCDFGAEPRSRIIATSAVKGFNIFTSENRFFSGYRSIDNATQKEATA